MSNKFRQQYADPAGALLLKPGVGNLLSAGSSAPADGGAYYAHGCIFINHGGTTEADALYVNAGSSTSCAFKPIDVTYFGGVTPGTVAASKGVVVDANKDIGTFRTITATNLALGGALPTNPQAEFSLAPAANATGVTANQSYYHAVITTTAGAVTIPAGTAPIVASFAVMEPNITATGTVTAATTVYIKDAPTEGSANYALWVDSGASRFDGNLDFSAGAADLIGIANTAAMLRVTDGTTALISTDSRSTLKNISNVTLTGVAPTIASETAAHQNPTLNLAAKTITYTGATGTTSQLGAMLNVGILTLTDTTGMTLTTASAIHINALAAGGGMLTITNSYMISTSVSGAFLSNAGVWTDAPCFAAGKRFVMDAAPKAIEAMIDRLIPKTWKYRAEVHGDDFDRDRLGIVYDELPDELKAPGHKDAVSGSLLASFALAALKVLFDRNKELESRLARLEG